MRGLPHCVWMTGHERVATVEGRYSELKEKYAALPRKLAGLGGVHVRTSPLSAQVCSLACSHMEGMGVLFVGAGGYQVAPEAA